MPDPAGVLAPLLLAGVLLLSGWAKWREPAATGSAIVLLRLPRWVQAPWVSRALPIGEALLAVAILAPWSPLVRAAAMAAVVLFVVYAVIVARALTFDPRPSCGCFGRIGDQRIVPKTLVRNLFLVGAAGVFAWFAGAGHTVWSTMAALDGTGWAWLAGAVLVTVTVVLIAPRSPAAPAPAPALAPLPPGPTSAAPSPIDAEADPEEYLRRPIPDAVLHDPDGTAYTLAEMAQQRPQLLVFVNCYCGSTHAALRLAQERAPRLPQVDVRPVFSGVPVMPGEPDLSTDHSWLDPKGVTWRTFGLVQSPSGVLLGADGLLAGGPVGGNAELAEFLDDIEAALATIPPALASASDAQE